MSSEIKVEYHGIPCILYQNYLREGDGPLVRVMHPKDSDAAYRDGFECIGYPDEVVKYLTDDEYQRLLQQFQSKTDASGSSVKHRGIMPR